MSIKPHSTAPDVTAEDGEVHVDGPGGLGIAMTPEAAAVTADRLHRGAREAEEQQRQIECP